METILIADHDPFGPDQLRELSQEEGYRLVTVEDGEQALDVLKSSNGDIGAAVLDWNIPGMSGIELLDWIRSQPTYKHMEVIVHARRISSSEAKKGINRGAFCVLHKPYPFLQLKAVLRAALSDTDLKRSLATELRQFEGALQLLTGGSFRVRTMEEAESLAVGLGRFCESCQDGLALYELLQNAIEHGNLGIGYREKSRLLKQRCFRQEVERRLSLAENAHLYVDVEVRILETCIEILITDQGSGFDFEKYTEFEPKRALDAHGRGILLARAMLGVEYFPPGNRVRVTAPLAKRHLRRQS